MYTRRRGRPLIQERLCILLGSGSISVYMQASTHRWVEAVIREVKSIHSGGSGRAVVNTYSI